MSELLSSESERYTPLRRLAVGGMGEIYLAHDETSREVVLKRLLPQLSEEPEAVRRFIDEGRLQQQLIHPNIVSVHSILDTPEGPALVLEYIAGQDLRSFLRALARRSEQCPPAFGLWVCAEVCAALNYAHKACDVSGDPLQLIHRDVSPSNILLSLQGAVKLIDFGLARAKGTLHQSISGALRGKIAYMSPEQARGEKLNAKSDLYSLALICFELLTGERLIKVQSEVEMLHLAREGVEDRFAQSAYLLPPGLRDLLGASLSRDPAVRPSGEHFEGALRTQIGDPEEVKRALAELIESTCSARGLPIRLPDSFDKALDEALGVTLGDPRARDTQAESLEQAQLEAFESQLSRSRTLSFSPIPLLNLPSAPTPPRPWEPIRQSEPLLIQTQSSRPLVIEQSWGDRERGKEAEEAELQGVLRRAGSASGLRKRLQRLRWLSLFLFIVLLISFGLILPSPSGLSRVELSVDPVSTTGSPLQSARWSIDGGPWSKESPRLEVGSTPLICVQERGYQARCQRRLILPGQNRHRITLEQVRTYPLPAPPAGGLQPRWLLNGVPLSGPEFRLIGDQPAKLCALSEDGKFWCQQLSRERAISLSWPWPLSSTKSAEANETKEESLPIAGRQRKRVVIKTQPVSTVRCGGRARGETPVAFMSAVTLRCIARRRGYPPHTFRVRPGERAEFQLPRFAQLRARALPPAATLWLNGDRVDNPLRRQLDPGTYLLEARLNGRREQREIELKEGGRQSVVLEVKRSRGQ